MTGSRKVALLVATLLMLSHATAARGGPAKEKSALERLLKGPKVINIIDDFLAFWKHAMDKPLRLQRIFWKRLVGDKHRDFFERAVYRNADAKQRRAMLEEFLTRIPPQVEAIRELNTTIHNSISEALVHFREYRFHDYRHQRDIFVGFSFFRFDGAVRPVGNDNGIPDTLCLGAEVLAGYTPEEVRIAIIHEFFHLYHFSFLFQQPSASDFRAAHIPLMIEGLAVAGSEEVFPFQPREHYLHFSEEDLATQQRNLVASASRYLSLVKRDAPPAEYERWFAKSWSADIPSRGGYLLGYEIVRRLTTRYTLEQLVRMTPAELGEHAEEQLGTMSGDRVLLYANSN
jgi:hypothetical protein